jgi:flagellar hook-associated protein 1 FlgK
MLLETGARSLAAHQIALETTGHNVANIDTPGYSRQRVDMSPTAPTDIVVAQLGTGVEAGRIVRIRQESLDLQVRGEASEHGYWESVLGALRAAETAFGDEELGLEPSLLDFFAAWQDLTTGPEEMPLRAVLVARAGTLADMFNAASDRLQGIHGIQDEELKGAIAEVNRLSVEIAGLNRDIFRGELSGQSANDLRDRRDHALDELSRLASITWTENADGRLDVFVGTDALVQGDTANSMSAIAGPDGWLVAEWDAGGSVSTASGVLAGIQAAHAEIGSLESGLNELAGAVISSVNGLHTSGFDLRGEAGLDFFQGTDAATISVNPALESDPALVAAAGTSVPGDNQVALAIAQLADAPLLPVSGPSATVSEHYGALAAGLGESARTAAAREEALSISLGALQAWRSSVSGVSVEEEMIDLVRYQRSYQAAARIITLVDEVMDLIVNRLGIGGR